MNISFECFKSLNLICEKIENFAQNMFWVSRWNADRGNYLHSFAEITNENKRKYNTLLEKIPFVNFGTVTTDVMENLIKPYCEFKETYQLLESIKNRAYQIEDGMKRLTDSSMSSNTDLSVKHNINSGIIIEEEFLGVTESKIATYLFDISIYICDLFDSEYLFDALNYNPSILLEISIVFDRLLDSLSPSLNYFCEETKSKEN